MYYGKIIGGVLGLLVLGPIGLILGLFIGHLFDRGLISFSDDGNLLISPKLDRAILAKWGVSETVNVGTFDAKQSVFLEYHRHSVFKKG